MPVESRRALITGISGFTGHYMAAELREHGYEVFGFGSAASDELNYFQADLNDGPALRKLLTEVKPNVVIHLAALAFVAHDNVDDFYRVNLLGTRQLLEAIVGAHCRPDSVLLASSANVYGNSAQSMLDEEVRPEPANDYAVSKVAMEYMAKLWGGRLPVIIVRPFNYTGVGQGENFLLPKIVSHFRRRADRIELGNLDVSRDFSDVRTVVHLYRRLIESPQAVGGTYNVSSGKVHSLRQVISICEELAGYSIEAETNPAFVRANEVRTLCGDSSRLRSLLGGWQHIELRSTLEWMLRDGKS